MKKLKPDNWLSPDPIIASGLFTTTSLRDGSSRALTPDDWAKRFLAIELDASVPKNVHDLFEVARGALLYGSLFYPLFTLGSEQLLRLAEAAARTKARAIVLPAKVVRGGYKSLLNALKENGAITEEEHQRWDMLRELRNVACHPEEQQILKPHDAVKALGQIAATVNRLFASS